MESKVHNQVFLLTVALTCVSGSNILFHPLFGEGSHYYVQKNIAVELIRRGHNVTVLMNSKFEERVKTDGKNHGFNVEFYQLLISIHEFNQFFQNMTSAGLKGKNLEFLTEHIHSDYMRKQIDECSNLLGNENVLTNLKQANFDIAIADFSCTCPVIQYLKLPQIIVSPILSRTFVTLLTMRSPVNPSYMPEFGTELDHRMSFVDRLKNTGFTALFCILTFGVKNPFQVILDRYGMDDKSFLEILYTDVEFWLENTNFVLDFPRPMLPNAVSVGGLTTGPANLPNPVSMTSTRVGKKEI